MEGKSKLIGVISDIHGRSNWIDPVTSVIDHMDTLLIMGDYFDSFDITSDTQIETFRKIMNLKNSYPDKIVCLLGNHDYHYTDMTDNQYSGYQPNMRYIIKNLLVPNIENGNIVLAHRINNVLFTHAGVTNTWLTNAVPFELKDEDMVDVDVLLNDIFKHRPQVLDIVISTNGRTRSNSPIWVRPKALLSDQIPNYFQVVGHTYTMYPQWSITQFGSMARPGVIFTDDNNDNLTILKSDGEGLIFKFVPVNNISQKVFAFD